VLYVTYGGLLEMNDTVMAATVPGAETAFEDQYFRTAPVFETGDERYAWLTTTAYVGRGRLAPEGVEDELDRLT
jgi:hypothetical protein